MNLDEAIKHAEDQSKVEGACDCDMEHAQLAEWLKELRKYKRREARLVKALEEIANKKGRNPLPQWMSRVAEEALTNHKEKK